MKEKVVGDNGNTEMEVTCLRIMLKKHASKIVSAYHQYCAAILFGSFVDLFDKSKNALFCLWVSFVVSIYEVHMGETRQSQWYVPS